MDYEWLADRLITSEYAEDLPELSKEECEKVLAMIFEKTGKAHMLIVNINIDFNGICYDYVLDNNETNKVLFNEWDNRYL